MWYSCGQCRIGRTVWNSDWVVQNRDGRRRTVVFVYPEFDEPRQVETALADEIAEIV
jgi:hypothetical protein